MLEQATNHEQPAKVFKIDLSSKNIAQLPNLRLYDRLRCLILDFNLFSAIPNLTLLPDLRELHLESNSICQITNLQPLRNLTVLNLRANRIERLDRINQLTKLQCLYLDDNRISKLTSLEYFHQLKVLSLKNNLIQCIDSLPSFSKLQTLILSKNKISSLSPLINCSKLTFLDISHNCLSSTSFLQPVTNLQSLDLSNNSIRAIQFVLPLLQSMDISHNQIDQLPYIAEAFPQLNQLNISHNYIGSQLALISAVAGAHSLADLDFRDNPMFSQGFAETIQKLHSFDRVNGDAKRKAGSKYLKEAEGIELGGEQDEEERKIRYSGFYDQALQMRMTGMKRPQSPIKKIPHNGLAEVEKGFNEFVENHKKIQQIRNTYLKLYQGSGLKVPQGQQGQQGEGKQLTRKEVVLDEPSPKDREVPYTSKESRQRSFNIRQALKRPNRQISSSKVVSASNGFAGKSEYSVRGELLKTRAPRLPSLRWN